MKKYFIPFILICALLLAVTVSCKNNPGGGGSDPVVPTPTRPATLELGNYKQYYAVGNTKADLIGTVYYTDTNGKITTLSLKSAELTIKTDDEGAFVAGENKTFKVTYQGIDCVGTYHVVKMDAVDIDGTYIFDKNTTYTFTSGSNSVKKEVFGNWNDYYNIGTEGAEDPVESTVTYSLEINTSGKTIIKFSDDSWPYRSDGKGGIDGKPSDQDYFDYSGSRVPRDTFYVSAYPEDNRMVTNTVAKGKYLVMAFDFYGNAYMWFTADTEASTLAALTSDGAAIKIQASQFCFGPIGVELEKQNITGYDAAGKNLQLRVYDGYNAESNGFSVTSYSDTGYNGYSYRMKRTDISPATALMF